MIFQFMTKTCVKKLGGDNEEEGYALMIKKTLLTPKELVMKIGCVPISFTPLAMLAVEFATFAMLAEVVRM
ncbi:hypothetical protein RHMOL_Rhmol04G0000800 [Rhododendron molle]|uniref:Uncharacterized protein n=1 Tax=Rhododendron molle TaxID=49168 RepID=A0ACC0NV89_RHOML|nr:hypothetical protein RHMOL_Rhmol04G0000800 [Rhododendron molle]